MIKTFRKYLGSLLNNSFEKHFELTIFITNACNMSCSHCFYGSRITPQSPELDLSSLGKIAASLPGNCKKIIITGGEPFLRDDILDIISIFKKQGIKDFSIATNGILTEKIAKFVDSLDAVKGINLSIGVSLDGFRETHDSIRNHKGAFDKAFNTLKMLKEKRVNSAVLTTVSRRNFRTIGLFDKYISDNLQTKVHYQFVRGSIISGLPDNLRNCFNPADNSLLPSEEEMERILSAMVKVYRQRIKDINSFLESVFNFTVLESKYKVWKKKKRIFSCVAGKSRAVIYPSGEVGVCEYINPVKEKLDSYGHNLNRLLAGEAIMGQRKIAQRCYCTHGCFIKVVGTGRFLLYFIGNTRRFLTNKAGKYA